jgi:alpha-D-ribose 1-methylphosphonate 5-triphosphate synthase subunit PhnG
MTPHTEDSDAQRRRWLAVLARAPRQALAHHAPPVLADHRFEWLRRPEVGLTMVRARVGNSGDRFNLGEATVTRCAARVELGGAVAVGIGYVLGRDVQRAEWVAGLDALLQLSSQQLLLQTVIAPLAEAAAETRHRRELRTAASRVRFYTLQTEAA